MGHIYKLSNQQICRYLAIPIYHHSGAVNDKKREFIELHVSVITW